MLSIPWPLLAARVFSALLVGTADAKMWRQVNLTSTPSVRQGLRMDHDADRQNVVWFEGEVQGGAVAAARHPDLEWPDLDPTRPRCSIGARAGSDALCAP